MLEKLCYVKPQKYWLENLNEFIVGHRPMNLLKDRKLFYISFKKINIFLKFLKALKIFKKFIS